MTASTTGTPPTPPSTTPASRGRAPSNTRERIIETAMQLYLKRGVYATSAREIAEELGVTKGTIFYHFPTTGDLVRAVLGPVLDATEEILATLPGCSDTDEERAAILKVLGDFYQEYAKPARLFVDNSQVWLDPALEGRPRAVYEQQLRQLCPAEPSPVDLLKAHLVVQAFMINVTRPMPPVLEAAIPQADLVDQLVRMVLAAMNAE